MSGEKGKLWHVWEHQVQDAWRGALHALLSLQTSTEAESWPPGLHCGHFPGSVYLLAHLEIMQPVCVPALSACQLDFPSFHCLSVDNS